MRRLHRWTFCWRDEEATSVDVLLAAVVPGTDNEDLEEDNEVAMWSIITTAKSQVIRNSSAPPKYFFWRKNQREVHISLSLFQITSSCDLSLSSPKCFNSNKTYKLSLPFSTTLPQTCTHISYIVYFTYLDYDSGATDHMSGNGGIMSFFNHASNSIIIVLADGSRTFIQGIGIAYHPYSSFIVCFLFTLFFFQLIISK